MIRRIFVMRTALGLWNPLEPESVVAISFEPYGPLYLPSPDSDSPLARKRKWQPVYHQKSLQKIHAHLTKAGKHNVRRHRHTLLSSFPARVTRPLRIVATDINKAVLDRLTAENHRLQSRSRHNSGGNANPDSVNFCVAI